MRKLIRDGSRRSEENFGPIQRLARHRGHWVDTCEQEKK